MPVSSVTKHRREGCFGCRHNTRAAKISRAPTAGVRTSRSLPCYFLPPRSDCVGRNTGSAYPQIKRRKRQHTRSRSVFHVSTCQRKQNRLVWLAHAAAADIKICPNVKSYDDKIKATFWFRSTYCLLTMPTPRKPHKNRAYIYIFYFLFFLGTDTETTTRTVRSDGKNRVA